MAQYRGSRLHVLDWVSSPRFPADLSAMCEPSRAIVTPDDTWLPKGFASPAEARLSSFGPAQLPGVLDWARLRSWWLAHTRGANTPNWDIASTCHLAGKRALILVEAKANVPELSAAGKPLKEGCSQASADNHEHIGTAIAEARTALASICPEIRISRDAHYQLSNRIAFAWRLASLGLPTILVYLGFTGDGGIADAGEPFKDAGHWKDTFLDHIREVVPETLLNRQVDCGAAPFWLLVRAREVMQSSTPI